MQKYGKRISACIREKLDEIDPKSKRPYNALLTDIIFGIILSDKSSTRDKLSAIEVVMDRSDGKPVNTNLNADINQSPFESIPTERIEALKAKLEAELAK
jgi:hypothetical protein